MIIDRLILIFTISENSTIRELLKKISVNQSRVIFVVSDSGELIGSVSDGDVRRWLVMNEQPSLESPCSIIANSACVTARDGLPAIKVEQLFSHKIVAIPIIDSRNRVVAVARPWSENFKIVEHDIGPSESTFVIAEIGINHNGDLGVGRELVDAALKTGADAIKLQLRSTDSLYRNSANGISEDLGAEYTLDLLKYSSLAEDDLKLLIDQIEAGGAVPLCTPWDIPSATTVSSWGISAYKVASADLTNHQLIQSLAQNGKPLLISTGMSTEAEIIETVGHLKALSCHFALLHCNSSYPAPYSDVNLNYIPRLREIGNCVVGYSGHERGYHVAVAAVALGAKIIEKHITLDKSAFGNDHKVSLLPDEFARMVSEIRDVDEAMGAGGVRTITQGEALNRLALGKSLVARDRIISGSTIAKDHIEIRSPGRGLSPNRLNELLGRKATREISAGDFFYESDIFSSAQRARAFAFRQPWGLPVRFHDWRSLVALSNPNFVEFHLSYRDLEIAQQSIPTLEKGMGFTVHSPDLFRGDFILDLASRDRVIRDRSVDELNRVIQLTESIADVNQFEARPMLIASLGGSSIDGFMSQSEVLDGYEILALSISRLNLGNVELLAQTLPPFPWYVGGQRFCNLFLDAISIADFSKQTGVKICLDTAHTKLACNYLRSSFSQAVEVIAPYAMHLHLVDCAGVAEEGLQVEEGEIDWVVLTDQINRLMPNVGFIPEIWQGHVDAGLGFWIALERLEKYIGKSI